MSQVSQLHLTTRFTTLLIVKVMCKHVNVKVYHVKFEVIRKYFFLLCEFDILISND